MNIAVHILATVRKPELLPAATLVFSTLRVGFPNADVMVWGNALEGEAKATVAKAAQSVGAGFTNVSPTAHDIWIEGLVNRMYEPFWIVDTDVVFFGPLTLNPSPHRMGRGNEVLAGRFEPEFMEEWTGTRHVERLHTAVMWIDPSGVRSAAREWMARIPRPWRTSAEFAWIRQVLAGRANDSETLFYDTMAGVYHALQCMDAKQRSSWHRAQPFTPEEDASFEHLCCGSYADAIDGEFGKALRAFHGRVFANPQAARGARLKQAEYYKLRSYPDGARKAQKGKK